MSDRTVAELLLEVKSTRDALERGDAERMQKITDKADRTEVQRISEDMARKTATLQTAVESLSRKMNRPGGSAGHDGADAERAAALGLLETKYALKIPRADPEHPPVFSEDDITEASLARKAMRSLLKVTSIDVLGTRERKALTSFQLGSSGFLLPPEWASQILSCFADRTDVTGWYNNITISGSSLKMFSDNTDLDQAMWSCDSDCWSAQRIKDLSEGLSEVEIKPEELRYIVCCSRDIIEDASIDVERWLFNKVSRAFQHTISAATMTGNGIGKPQGVLHPSSGIPVCDVSANTPPSQFTWQDLIMLKWEVPIQWQGAGSAYGMNQKTFALCLTLSDAMGRPLMIAMPTDAGVFRINGSPVWINTWFPDVAPGAVPVAFANWPQLYTLVTRRGITWQQDPFSAGFCILQKFSARIGGSVTCPASGRLLRIR